MATTVNEGISKISAELKETNLRFDKSVDAYKQMVATQGVASGALKGIGGAIKDNVVKSSSGFQSFISQMEQLPVFGAISGIAKTLGGKAFSVLRQRKEDANLAKQLGITKEEVAIRRKEQELLVAQKDNNDQLLNAARMLGYMPEEFEKLTGSADKEKMTAKEVEQAREQRRSNEKLVEAVEGVSDGIEGLEGDGDDKEKGIFSGILDKVKGFVPAIGAALVTLGTTILGGLTALGSFIVLGLKKLPGLGRRAGRGLMRGASKVLPAAGGLLKGAGKLAMGAAKFAGPIGLAVTAGMGIFDGLTAGIEEYKKSGNIGKAVKEGFAGAVSGLTFGLIDQETISNGMTAIGDFAKGAWDGYTGLVSDAVSGVGSVLNSAVDGFENLTGLTVPTNLTEVRDAVSNTISSAVSGFNNLTGLNVPTNLTEVKDAVGNALSSAAEGFNNLTGLSIPTNLTELKDSVSSTFDAVGQGFTNLTGIEVPTFDDLSAKVGAFADNMKENISKGWESVTNMASDAWGGIKGFFGFGEKDKDAEEKKLQQEKHEKLTDQKMINDMEMEEISQRMDKFERGKNAYLGRDTQAKYDKDQARFDELMAEQDKLDAELANTTPIKYPSEMQFGFAGQSVTRVFFKYRPDGSVIIPNDQEAAAEEYSNITPVATESAQISTLEGGGKTVKQTGQAMNAYEKKMARLEAKRANMGSGGNATVINAPNNSVTSSGGGGSPTIPVSTRDNSSASTAAAVAAF